MKKFNQTAFVLSVLMILFSACAVFRASGYTPSSTAQVPTSLSMHTPAPSAKATITISPIPSQPPAVTFTPTKAETATLTPVITQTATSVPTVPPFDIQALIDGPTPTALVLPTSVSANPLPTATSSGNTPEPSPTDTLFDEYLPRGKQVAETDHFLFYAQDNYMPVDLNHWKQVIEELYGYDRQRLGADSPVKISIAFLPTQTQACPIRGLAATEGQPMIIVFADPTSSELYLKAVLAHEIGHAINAQGFPEGIPTDLALAEGLATYTSGKYWDELNNVSSIHEYVKNLIASGDYLPLYENVDMTQIYPWQPGTGKGCLVRRDHIYTEWGSFLGFLIDRYGWDKVHQLFKTDHTESQGKDSIHYPSDYQAVFGKALNQLEVDWLVFLSSY